MENYNFEVDKDLEGTRIDLVLSLLLPDTSRSFIQKLIDDGKLSINGKVCTVKKEKVREKDILSLEIPEPEILEIKAENIPLDIVYEDDDVLVVNKPKGMVVHPAVGNYTGTLVNAIMYHSGDKLSSINGVIRPGIVHRIDKDTSGLLVIAKNDNAHEKLSKQLEKHSITRRYTALVHDGFSAEEGVIDLPIGRDPKNRLRRAVNGIGAKNAVTNYKVLEKIGRYTLIECRLETGRTHQIRVHMAYMKHPIAGDLLYGHKDREIHSDGQLLHARVLGFVHPVTNEYMEFSVPLPEEFERELDHVRSLMNK